MALALLSHWHVFMFQLLHHDSSCCSNYLIAMIHAKPMAPGLDLAKMHLCLTKAIASNLHAIKCWIYWLQNWLLALLAIKPFNALPQILPFLKPNKSTICLLSHTSFYAYTIAWATKISQSYRSGPLKAKTEFWVMSQVVQSQCVMHASMALQRNMHMKPLTLALWLALHQVPVIFCWWIKWLQVVQDWFHSPVDDLPTIDTSLSWCGMTITQGSYMHIVKKRQQSSLLLNPRKILKCLQNATTSAWSTSIATMESLQPRLSEIILMHVISNNHFVVSVLIGRMVSSKGTLV